MRIRAEKDNHLAAKIVKSIRKFRVSMFGLKALQKELSVTNFKSDTYTHEEELVNLRLDLEHDKNMALIELQRKQLRFS